MARSLWVIAPLPLALLPACQRGSAGPLDPVAAADVTRFADERWDHAAIVREPALTARVVDRWRREARILCECYTRIREKRRRGSGSAI
jgi:hypothetical protein